MLTWRLHHTLQNPLRRDPISWRGYEGRLGKFVTYVEPRFDRFTPVMTAAFVVIVPPVVGMSLLVIFFPAPLLALLASLLFGLRTVERISAYLAGEHRRRAYDLLCSLPAGKISLHWVYATQWFQATPVTRMVLRGLMILGLAAAPFLFGGWLMWITHERAVAFWFADTLAFWAFLLYEYFNTRIVAVLIGMLVPALTRKTRTIFALAVGGYLLVQVATYLLGAVVAVTLLPDLLVRLNAPPIAAIVIGPITAAVVIIFRELLTHGLWHTLRTCLNTTREEINSYIY